MSLQDISPADQDDPYEIDTSVAHPARVYDCLLGGHVNFEADAPPSERPPATEVGIYGAVALIR